MHNFLQIFAHRVITKVSRCTGNIKSRINCWSAHTLKTQLQVQVAFSQELLEDQATYPSQETDLVTAVSRSVGIVGFCSPQHTDGVEVQRKPHEFHNMLVLPNMFCNVDPFIRRCREI